MQNTAHTRLKGVLSPVLTPFKEDLSPDGKKFVAHCRWLLSRGVGLAMFGTNSEGNSLSVAEKIKLLDSLVESGVGLSRAMPGTGSCSLSEAVTLTRESVDRGAAGVLVLPPFYYKAPVDDGLFAFFSELIERVSDARLRVYLYHIPPVSMVGFSPDLVGRLKARYPEQIAGMKDTGGKWDYTELMIREFRDECFDVFAGTETILLDVMRFGGPGCITATANVNPSAIVHLYENWREANAVELQAQVNASRELFSKFPLIPAMKAAIAQFRDDETWRVVRPPLVALSDKQRTEFLRSLRTASFAIPSLA